MTEVVNVTVEQSEETNVTIQAVSSAVDSLPAGWIRIFLGAIAGIPAGWLLCDGSNGTPDLRGTFIRGAQAGSPSGGVGGAENHQHSLDLYSGYCGCHCHWVGGDTTWEAGSHSHSVYGSAEPCYMDYIEVDYGTEGYYASCCYHGHDICAYTDCGEGYHNHELAGYTTYDGDHCHRVCGSVAPGSNLPPYYEVLFIMKA